MTSSHRDCWLNAYSTFSLLWKDDSHNETGIKIKAEKLFASNWLAFWQQGAFMSPQSYSTCIVPQTWKITAPIHLLNAFLLNCSTYKHAQTINMNCTQNVLIPPTECNNKRKLFLVFFYSQWPLLPDASNDLHCIRVHTQTSALPQQMVTLSTVTFAPAWHQRWKWCKVKRESSPIKFKGLV